jgi:hypothetical protein
MSMYNYKYKPIILALGRRGSISREGKGGDVAAEHRRSHTIGLQFKTLPFNLASLGKGDACYITSKCTFITSKHLRISRSTSGTSIFSSGRIMPASPRSFQLFESWLLVFAERMPDALRSFRVLTGQRQVIPLEIKSLMDELTKFAKS